MGVVAPEAVEMAVDVVIVTVGNGSDVILLSVVDTDFNLNGADVIMVAGE